MTKWAVYICRPFHEKHVFPSRGLVLRISLKLGGIAQLVQSICLTSRGSLVRIRLPPLRLPEARFGTLTFWDLSSAGSERMLHTHEVTGSNPVGPTSESPGESRGFLAQSASATTNTLPVTSTRLPSSALFLAAMTASSTDAWIVPRSPCISAFLHSASASMPRGMPALQKW